MKRINNIFINIFFILVSCLVFFSSVYVYLYPHTCSYPIKLPPISNILYICEKQIEEMYNILVMSFILLHRITYIYTFFFLQIMSLFSDFLSSAVLSWECKIIIIHKRSQRVNYIMVLHFMNESWYRLNKYIFVILNS